ncbi:RNA-binding protein FUS-like isoform X2 [Melanotaenia boesemani]|uniref:RNA-binding protein FUS-like isoform X1 n=1 Tax=Melanotaenia boesemani TaxID=1250792 RepID=UPI001C046858|nr:RNA-binding protein FUS-like isoform X1 [Melanotaenia boesemani]XP_041852072.1 RNA-binding protein FUS-like isoform X2 [Melanotaenia boesemani]
MRVLWISLLLVGSITCFPQESGGPVWYPAPSSGGSQDPHHKPTGQSGSGTAGSPGFYYSSGSSHPASDTSSFFSSGAQSQPESSGYSSFSSSFQPASGAGGAQQSGQSGFPGGQSGFPGGHQSAQGGWSSSDGGDQEPDITPVSAEDQVYAHKSRSQYRKSNLRFHQFIYIPTEPAKAYEPIFPHHGKGQVHKGF